MKAEERYELKAKIRKIKWMNLQKKEKWGKKERLIAQKMLTQDSPIQSILKLKNNGRDSYGEKSPVPSFKEILEKMKK